MRNATRTPRTHSSTHSCSIKHRHAISSFLQGILVLYFRAEGTVTVGLSLVLIWSLKLEAPILNLQDSTVHPGAYRKSQRPPLCVLKRFVPSRSLQRHNKDRGAVLAAVPWRRDGLGSLAL